MATTIMVMRKYKIKKGKLAGYVGRCVAADFSDNIHGHFVLIEVDDTVSLFVHPKDVELVPEPDELDLRQILLPGMEAQK